MGRTSVWFNFIAVVMQLTQGARNFRAEWMLFQPTGSGEVMSVCLSTNRSDRPCGASYRTIWALKNSTSLCQGKLDAKSRNFTFFRLRTTERQNFISYKRLGNCWGLPRNRQDDFVLVWSTEWDLWGSQADADHMLARACPTGRSESDRRDILDFSKYRIIPIGCDGRCSMNGVHWVQSCRELIVR